ncbi:MAG: GNAT family N-acetyltransferase [Azonexus sp.]
MGLSGDGKPRRLTTAARPAVLAHLLALSADDRYGRFATALSDAGIVAYVARIDFAGDLCLATQESDGRLSGFIHLAVHGAVAELGASVLPQWRHQGRARLLFGAALAAASAGGMREIHLATGHPAARHICAGLGYAMTEGAGYAMTEGAGYPRVRVQLPQSGKFIGFQSICKESPLPATNGNH